MSATGWWAEVFLIVRPNPAVLHVSGGSPIILSGKRILAAAAALTVTGAAPTVVVTQHKTVQPSPAVLTIVGSRPVQGTSARPITGALTVTGGTPTILLSDNQSAQPAPAVLALTGSAPGVSATANQFVAPSPAVLTIAGGVPLVTASDLKLIRPAAATLAITGGTPTAGVGLTFIPSALSLSVTMGTPTVTATQNRFVTPTNVALTVTGGQPVVRAPRLVTPTGGSLTITGGTPTVTVASTAVHYTDDFNRANSSNLGASWTALGTSMSINSNIATGTGGGGVANVYASTMNTDDQKVAVVMKGTNASDQAYIFLRINSPSPATQYAYAQLINGSTWYVYRDTSDGSPATASSQSWADGDTISFEVQGTTARLKKNGSTIVTANSVTVTTGRYVALQWFSPSSARGFDSFDAQDI